MLNQYPLWKYIMLITVLVIGAIYSLPNIYGEDPSVQISHRSNALHDEDRTNVEQLLNSSNIAFISTELSSGRLLIRFGDESTQLTAAEVLKDTLEKDHYVALNLAPATPQWLRSLGASPMYLGLDLRGGVHFLMEVDMPSAIKRLEESNLSDIRSYLRGEKIRYRGITRGADGINIKFRDSEIRIRLTIS